MDYKPTQRQLDFFDGDAGRILFTCSSSSSAGYSWIRNYFFKETGMPDRMLQFFQYSHLPANLQGVSKPYCDLAHTICDTYPMNPERTVTLRKLLEAKDAAVRTFLYKETS